MTIGIICEYNPFHNGHIYHLNKIKDKYKDSTLILVMSGNITQRGDLSIMNKWDKTEIALKYGIDLVVELPFYYAVSSADNFAKGALMILNELKVDKIIFGSETNDTELLLTLATASLSDEYNNILKKHLKVNSFANASANALYELTNFNLNTPNDILGMCYIREILKNNYPINFDTIKRTNDYNNENLEEIASATSIRLALKNKKDIRKYVPIETINKIDMRFQLDNYFNLIKYKIITSDNLNDYVDIDEKLSRRFKKYILNVTTIEELISFVKSKNYTYNKIKRDLVYILIDFKKKNLYENHNYIRLLGFNKNGKKHLNKIKKDIRLPIITNYSDSNNMLDLDYKINSILSLCLEPNLQIEWIINEKKEVIRFIN